MKLIISNTQIHGKEYDILVKKYETIKPEINEIECIFRDVVKDYRKSFSYKRIKMYV